MKDLRQRLDELGVSTVGCLEKADLVARLRQAESQQGPKRPAKESAGRAAEDSRGQAPLELRTKGKLCDFLEAEGLCIIAWYAKWCPLCRQVMPEYGRLAAAEKRARFARVDVDVLVKEAESHGAERYGKRLPTFHAFRDGERVGEMKGADPKALATFIQRKASTYGR